MSRTALRAYLTTILAFITAFVLFALAVAAYALFYFSYIPRIGFSRTIHLQFDNLLADRTSSMYPYGTVNLRPDVVGAQQYDISIELTFPRTPQNVAAGNFMLDVRLYPGKSVVDRVQAGLTSGDPDPKVLAASRRPAILEYRSPMVELVYKFTELPWYLLGFRKEAEHLTIPMFEGVEFSRAWREVPEELRLEVQSTSSLQIYNARAVFRARFRGLRWLMYNHRIVSAVVFIGTFWVTEIFFAGLTWAALTVFLTTRPTQDIKAEQLDAVAERIKTEDDAVTPRLSDTERTFPTLSGQQPLKYSVEPRVKQEDVEMEAVMPEFVAPGVEGDVEDEDEEGDFFVDSGLGTSLESSGPKRRESMRRRRVGRTGPREEG